MITAALQDIQTGKVTNRLIAAGLLTGAVFQVLEHKVLGIWFFLGNISVPVILFYLLFQMRVLGAGDIKLFSMTGGLLHFGELCRCIRFTFLAAGVGAVLFLAADEGRRQNLWCAWRYLREFFCSGKCEPYQPLRRTGRMRFAFAVCILYGAYAALYVPPVW